MEMQGDDDGLRVIPLPMDLTIGGIGEVHAQFRQAMAGTAAIQLDGGHVDRVDAAGLQVLLALVETSRTLGRQVTIADASASIQSVAQTLGLLVRLRLQPLTVDPLHA
jgi:anti-anti-sigma regulatory factor